MAGQPTESDRALEAYRELTKRYATGDAGADERMRAAAVAWADKHIDRAAHPTFASLVEARLPIVKEILSNPEKRLSVLRDYNEKMLDKASPGTDPSR